MSHCTLEATLKPTHFLFIHKTVLRNVFTVQVCWKAVPKHATWSGTMSYAKTIYDIICRTKDTSYFYMASLVI